MTVTRKEICEQLRGVQAKIMAKIGKGGTFGKDVIIPLTIEEWATIEAMIESELSFGDDLSTHAK